MISKPSYRLPQSAKLKSRKHIQQLFAEGSKINAYPVRCIWRKSPEAGEIRVAVSVSSRHFKKAVDRNRVKRLLRECWRLNKPVYFPAEGFIPAIDVFLVYTGTELPVFAELERSIITLFKKLVKLIHEAD